MEVIPAIDIMKGRVVRLLRGDPKFITSYETQGDPLSVAKRWESEGARMIHLVDLDAALGLGDNLEVIRRVVAMPSVSMQVGGGIRSFDKARALLEMGVERVMLGSLAFREPSTLKSVLEEFGSEHVVVALDHVDGSVVFQGWRASSNEDVEDAVSRFSEMGVTLFLVTSVERDGTLAGPDVERLARLVSFGVRVIAAGGIGSLDDVIALKNLKIYGVVIGKALYEGAVSLREALRVAEEG